MINFYCASGTNPTIPPVHQSTRHLTFTIFRSCLLFCYFVALFHYLALTRRPRNQFKLITPRVCSHCHANTATGPRNLYYLQKIITHYKPKKGAPVRDLGKGLYGMSWGGYNKQNKATGKIDKIKKQELQTGRGKQITVEKERNENSTKAFFFVKEI